jgi:hypothetical protein
VLVQTDQKKISLMFFNKVCETDEGLAKFASMKHCGAKEHNIKAIMLVLATFWEMLKVSQSG